MNRRGFSSLLRGRGLGILFAVLALSTLFAAQANAQPFGMWNVYNRATVGYIEIPHNAALNPTSGITIEGWVNVTDPGGCSNIIGKGYTTAWWVGICGTTLRSYLRGSGSFHDGGSLATRNGALIDALLGEDRLIVAGQAASHCVKSSIDDLLDAIRDRNPALARRVYVLEDAMSAVAVPDPIARSSRLVSGKA